MKGKCAWGRRGERDVQTTVSAEPSPVIAKSGGSRRDSIGGVTGSHWTPGRPREPLWVRG
jgi:hypothetical protein